MNKMSKRAYEHTRFFTEDCGQRIAGTPQVLKASDYILDYYRENGIMTDTHEFEVPVSTIKKSVLQVYRNDAWEDIRHTPAIFSKATPEGGMDLELVYVENGNIASFKTKDVRGKAALICRDVYFEYPDINMYKRLYEYGAAAVIYTTTDGHWDVPFVYANFETMHEEFTIPTFVIHWKRALELLNSGVNKVHLEFDFEIELGKTRTTIGVVEGSGDTDESIVVCAHLDSAISSVGAADDVAGVAMVMELARYYNEEAKAGRRPEKMIRFIAWSGHECGLHGSKYYLKDHMDIYDKTRFVLNYDIVGNTLSNYSAVGGFNDEVREKLNEITASLDLEWAVTAAPMVCDTLNFAAKEIPQITLSAGFFCGNHTKYDSLDLISPEGFDHPLMFSEAVINWAANETVSQGYPEELNEGMRACCEMYGWGMFDIV